VLKEGEIHPDLANRLASEAARSAQQVLQMCIRAIDYCPPVGITFGDYLRAIVTADYDMNPDDTDNYRLAFVENFRRWGISPRNMLSMSVESLLWPSGKDVLQDHGAAIPAVPNTAPADQAALRALFSNTDVIPPETNPDAPKRSKRTPEPKLVWDLESDRKTTWEAIDNPSFAMWHWLIKGGGRQLLHSFGLIADPVTNKNSIYRSKSRPELYAVNVQSVRSALRRSPRGGSLQDLVVEVTQRRRGYLDSTEQKQKDSCPIMDRSVHGDFMFRAGCTLLMNPKTMEIRRVIRTSGDITDDKALDEMRTYLTEKMQRMNSFDGVERVLRAKEPFALLHREEEKPRRVRTKSK